MRIIRGIKTCCEKFPYPVLTLGNFDGVHLGHQAIFKTVVDRAREAGGTAMAFTFEPHPLKLLAPERSPRLLNTFHAKMKLMESSGMQVVICADFDRQFAEQHPEDFARTVLVDGIGVKEVFVGYDYAFGKGREGSIASLKRMGEAFGFSVGVVDAVQVDGTVVSSSLVRDLVSSGRVDEVPRYLGRYYHIEGTVVHGESRGRTLGFPTANIHTSNELLPAFGVYAVRAVVGGRPISGAASIGIRPTFGDGPVSLEVFLLDYEGDLYGKHLEVFFIKRLRGEQKFPDADALVRQMQLDVQEARAALADRK
ncbi:MAG: bifunctional riboflavin kinase/FAD synthetase [Nitrospiraceae bacterium]|nr:bifunctional riboflavin kinase/FAD synthetase [Nitrospiraceae bacterium]